MASRQILKTRDGQWKVEVEAWKINLLVYRSLGVRVQVFHWETKRNLWGDEVTAWVLRPALTISITSVYRDGSGTASATRHITNNAESACVLMEHASRGSIALMTDGSPGEVGTGRLAAEQVEGTVEVLIGLEVLTSRVSA